MKLNKAILPVAGLGTRFLPATKSIPKEMLPIVDTPLVEFAVDEAVDAVIVEIIFITSHTNIAIQEHFRRNIELEQKLLDAEKDYQVERINLRKYKSYSLLFKDFLQNSNIARENLSISLIISLALKI